MDKTAFAALITIAFSGVGIVGDYFLKLASQRERPLLSASFYLGFCLYASTAFGWVFVMKYLKLGTIGGIYSVCMILFLTTIGVIFFRETLNHYEIAGLVLAIVSLTLLTRFA